MRQHERLGRAMAHHHRRRTSAYRVSQRARVGRAGTIEITADTDGTVWVGGAATGCIRGTITL